MFRSRIATLALAAGLGLSCGCTSVTERSWFGWTRVPTCCPTCEAGCSAPCCNGPLLDGTGPVIVPSGTEMRLPTTEMGLPTTEMGLPTTEMGLPTTEVIPPLGAEQTIPSLEPTPRLVPQPQAAPEPYNPNIPTRGRPRRLGGF